MWVCRCAQHRHRGQVLQLWELNLRDYQSRRSPLVPTRLSSPLGYSVCQGLLPLLPPPLPPLPPHSWGWDPPQITGKPLIVIPGAPPPPITTRPSARYPPPAPSRSFASLQLFPPSPPFPLLCFGGSLTVSTVGNPPARHPRHSHPRSLPIHPLVSLLPSPPSLSAPPTTPPSIRIV